MRIEQFMRTLQKKEK